jgi:hypothetical protein
LNNFYGTKFIRRIFGSKRDEVTRGWRNEELHNLYSPLVHESEEAENYCLIELTQWSRVLLEKLILIQMVKKFLILYGTQSFITVFTTAYHWTLS